MSLQRDILDPAGVSNGSFYHQFENKTELLTAILEDGARAAAERRDSANLSTGVDGLEARVRQRVGFWLELVDSAEDLYRIQIRERNNPDKRVRKLVAEVRQRTAKRLASTPHPGGGLDSLVGDPQLAGRLVGALTTGMLMEYLDMPKRQRATDRDVVIDGMTAFIAGGLRGLSEANPAKVGAS